MEWNRAELLHSLKLVQPALGKPQSDVFENIWFLDGSLLACNDEIGLTTTGNEDGTTGGVNGERLIKLLQNCSAETVTLTNGRGGLHITADRSKVLLHTDDGDPPLVWPQVEEGTPQVEVGDAFVTACTLAKLIIDPHANAWQARGMAVVCDGAGVTLYATDRRSAMRTRLGPQPDMHMASQWMLTQPFIEQIIKRAPGWLSLADTYALFHSNRVGLWGRYVDDDEKKQRKQRKQADFDAAFRNRWPPELVPLPDGFRQSVLRAGALAEREAKMTLCTMHIDGVMTISSHSGPGEIEDELEFDHPEVGPLLFDQTLIERLPESVHKHLTQIGVTAKALTFASDDGSIAYMNATHDG